MGKEINMEYLFWPALISFFVIVTTSILGIVTEFKKKKQEEKESKKEEQTRKALTGMSAVSIGASAIYSLFLYQIFISFFGGSQSYQHKIKTSEILMQNKWKFLVLFVACATMFISSILVLTSSLNNKSDKDDDQEEEKEKKTVSVVNKVFLCLNLSFMFLPVLAFVYLFFIYVPIYDKKKYGEPLPDQTVKPKRRRPL